MLSRILILVSATLLVSCASGGSNKLCVPDVENLIHDPSFAIEAENMLSRAWGQSQHAGEQSFKTNIENGVLTISRVGTQPWFSYKQVRDLSQYAGQKMVFSADLKLDLQPPKISHQFGDGGGLSLLARSANRKLLLRSVLEHEPHMGKTDWQTVQVVVELPPETQWVTLAFLYQADGVMQVRNPVFGPVTADTQLCPTPQ